MKEVPAHEILARLFGVIVSEAQQSPTLARKLIEAFPETLVAKYEKPVKKSGFDPAQYHAVNILRLHGENVLRGKLEQVKSIKELKEVVNASGLTLSGEAAKPRAKKSDVIEGIISAAKHYEAQRESAAK